MKNFLLLTLLTSLFLTSCSSVNQSMREPNSRLELVKSDFSLSDQVSATATTTRILGIDFERLFNKRTGVVDGYTSSTVSLSSIPVIGNVFNDNTSNYALYELMQKNPNYDVVLYPQYETKVSRPILGLGFIFKKTTVKTTERLAQLKK